MTLTTFEYFGPGCWLWRRAAVGQCVPSSSGRVERTAEPLLRRWRARVDGASGGVGHGLTRLAAVDAAERAATAICPILENSLGVPTS